MEGNFEVLPLGYSKEIRLSRELTRAIEQNLAQWGNVVPQDIINAYNELRKHYQWQIEQGLA